MKLLMIDNYDLYMGLTSSTKIRTVCR